MRTPQKEVPQLSTHVMQDCYKHGANNAAVSDLSGLTSQTHPQKLAALLCCTRTACTSAAALQQTPHCCRGQKPLLLSLLPLLLLPQLQWETGVVLFTSASSWGAAGWCGRTSSSCSSWHEGAGEHSTCTQQQQRSTHLGSDLANH